MVNPQWVVVYGHLADWSLVGPFPNATTARQYADKHIDGCWADIMMMAKPIDDAEPDLLAELRTSMCPGGGWNGMPADTLATVDACLEAGVCGCSAGAAVARALGIQQNRDSAP